MSLKNVNHQKRSFTWSMEKPSAKDYFLTVFIFAVCTLIGLLFQKLNFTDTNIVTIYILGVLLTSIVTDGYLCSVAGSFLSVFLFCFFLTEPRMSFKTYAVGYPVTFFIMLISSVLTGALAAKLKTHAKLSTQLAFRAQILFDTDRLLQKAKGETEILDVTCTQLLRLLNRNITAYVVENGTLSEGKLFSGEKEDTEDFLIPEEQQIAKWVCENRQHAGASTHHFPQAKCLYLAIRSGDNVYGVIGIPLQKETLDTFEYSILLSVINECALAMENAKNALEKEKNAVILAHYYVDEDVQDIADYIGDSFYLSKVATKVSQDRIIFAGVEFMGESAKILNPDKRVFMPDMNADCPMAHMADKDEILKLREEYDDLAVVCYINSTAELKKYSDVCVTSSNAVKIVKNLPNKNIFFIPDRNLGSYVAKQCPDKNFIFNNGCCPRHVVITKDMVLKAKELHPEARFAAHPECTEDVLAFADYVGSTSGIIDYVVDTDADEYIIGTVDGVFNEIRKKAPDKKLYTVKPDQVCVNMKKVTLDKVLDVLENDTNEVFVDKELADHAMKPLNKMLELAAK